jgi:hydroxymethylpyrimidine/phosphomethylpyrimidine kinase
MYREPNGHVVRALTVAGSDSGGGAGIQADLKTLHQFDVYGMSVVTALTAQNTRGVQSIYDISPEFVGGQLRSVVDDFGMDAVKTGMLSSADIIREVADVLSANVSAPLVVDPVMVAKGGAPLLQPTAVEVLKYRLLPLATVATPNLPEAEVICGYPLTTWHDCQQAARDIAGFGVKFVVIKGGHTFVAGQRQTSSETALDVYQTSAFATDIVYIADTDEFTYLVTPRVDSHKTHGTGCTYSAAITALLARGIDPLAAIAGAKAFVYNAIERARTWDVGHGHGPTDHSSPTAQEYTPQIGQFNVYRQARWTVV